MNLKSLTELELTEILKIAQDGEKKLKDMSDHATMMAEKWRVKSQISEKQALKSHMAQSPEETGLTPVHPLQ